MDSRSQGQLLGHYVQSGQLQKTAGLLRLGQQRFYFRSSDSSPSEARFRKAALAGSCLEAVRTWGPKHCLRRVR
jgi:hypothetical protein